VNPARSAYAMNFAAMNLQRYRFRTAAKIARMPRPRKSLSSRFDVPSKLAVRGERTFIEYDYLNFTRYQFYDADRRQGPGEAC